MNQAIFRIPTKPQYSYAELRLDYTDPSDLSEQLIEYMENRPALLRAIGQFVVHATNLANEQPEAKAPDRRKGAAPAATPSMDAVDKLLASPAAPDELVDAVIAPADNQPSSDTMDAIDDAVQKAILGGIEGSKVLTEYVTQAPWESPPETPLKDAPWDREPSADLGDMFGDF